MKKRGRPRTRQGPLIEKAPPCVQARKHHRWKFLSLSAERRSCFVFGCVHCGMYKKSEGRHITFHEVKPNV